MCECRSPLQGERLGSGGLRSNKDVACMILRDRAIDHAAAAEAAGDEFQRAAAADRYGAVVNERRADRPRSAVCRHFEQAIVDESGSHRTADGDVGVTRQVETMLGGVGEGGGQAARVAYLEGTTGIDGSVVHPGSTVAELHRGELGSALGRERAATINCLRIDSRDERGWTGQGERMFVQVYGITG